MKIVVDGRPAVDPRRTGVGTYVWNLLRRLPVVDPSSEYVAWYGDARPGRDRPRLDVPGVAERPVRLPNRILGRAARFRVPLVEILAPCDVVFGTNFVAPPTRRIPGVVTIHDLAFRLFPDTAPEVPAWWRRAVDTSVRAAARIVVPSETTRGDLLRSYEVDPGRVAVIPMGVDPSVFAPASEDRVEGVRRRLGIVGPYLVVLGRHPRKNLPTLLRAFAMLPDDVRPMLVVAGAAPRTQGRSDLEAGALERLPEPVRGQVMFVGYVGEDAAAAVLSGSLGLAFPSRYEGFGFPALEAMACGAPVLTSNTSSLPELVGDAAILVDPEDEGSIADGLLRLVTDGSLRERLRASGLERAQRFSWEATARATADVLRDAALTGRREGRPGA